MGFFSGVATGFFKQQNEDFANQQQQQDKLTQMSLANILKNVDNYNSSKAEYQQKQTKAEALSAQTGLATGDVMGMLNMDFSTNQIIQQSLHKQQTTPQPSPGNITQQTQTAIPGAGSTATPPSQPSTTSPQTNPSIDTSLGSSNAPVPATPAVTADSTQPPPQQSIPGVHKTVLDHVFGTDPSQGIGQAATAQAGTVTGMSADEVNQARTGHFSPTAMPTSNFRIDPSQLVDWSKFDPSHYSAKNLPQAIQAMKQGDMGTAVGLADNADDKTKRALSLAYAEHAINKQDDFAKDNHDIAAMAALPDPDNPGQKLGMEKASQAYYGSKYKALGSGTDTEINPTGLSPDDYYASLKPAEKTLVDGYTSGRVKWSAGMGKGGQEIAQRNLRMIQAVDPTFTPSTAEARFKTNLDLAPGGKLGTQITSANAIINHLFDFNEAMSKLNNGEMPFINDAKNWSRSHLSSNPAYTDALQAQGFATDELDKFLHGTSTIEGREKAREKLPMNKGGVDEEGVPNNQKIIGNLLELMEGKLKPIAEQVNRVYGKNVNAYDLVSPEAKEKLIKLGYKAPDTSVNMFSNSGVPGQNTPSSNGPVDQSNPPPMEKLQEGHVTSFANGQSWILQNGQPKRVK